MKLSELLNKLQEIEEEFGGGLEVDVVCHNKGYATYYDITDVYDEATAVGTASIQVKRAPVA